MKKLCYIVGVVLSVSVVACNEPFEPKGPYEERLVVYGILSTLTDTQYVRVYTTYNPDGFDPFSNVNDKQVQGATVSLAGTQGTVFYRDTVVTRSEKERYPSDIFPYVLSPFSPTPGATYTLNVQLPAGASAGNTISVPDRGSIVINTLHVVIDPNVSNEDLRIEARISPKTRGLLVRMYMEFEIEKDGVVELIRAEVPSRVRGFDESNLVDEIYPSLQRRQSVAGGNITRSEFISFQNQAYRTFRANLTTEYSGWRITYKRILFVLWQVEPNLYNYYNIVNGFRDDISIRTDEPDYSGVNGALGVFGAMTVDTSTYVFRQ